VPDPEQTWIARLTPVAGRDLSELLALPLGLDVWERHPGSLVVAAAESRLLEVERRHLAHVERLGSREQHEQMPGERSEDDRRGIPDE
jgi:hypothetical protein